MAAMIISLPDERVKELNEKARRLGVAPEELVRASIDALLTEPDTSVEQAMEHVLRKNAELYRRLA